MWYKSNGYKGLAPTSYNNYYVLSLVLDYIDRVSAILTACAAIHEKNKESHLSTTTGSPPPPYTRNYGRSRTNYF
jgi:hypothetical protein